MSAFFFIDKNGQHECQQKSGTVNVNKRGERGRKGESKSKSEKVKKKIDSI